MSKLKIGKSIEHLNPISTYEICINYMHGDAVKYESEIIYISDEETVIEFIKIIKEITNNKKTQRDRSTFINKYPKFFDENYLDENEGYLLTFVEWPGDCTCDSMYAAAIIGCDIFYFDENGFKYEVEYSNE